MTRPQSFSDFERSVMSPAPTIYVIYDDPSARDAIEHTLLAAGFAVSTYASAQDFLKRYDPDAPGCLVFGLATSGLASLDLQTKLMAIGNPPPMIFLAACARIADSVQAMKNGAVEFLLKPVDDDVLVEAVKNAVAKNRQQLAERTELADVRKRLATLSQRQFEVLCFLVMGRRNKQIAYDLGVVEKTIKVHRHHTMQKMGVTSIAALVALDVRVGFSSARACI
jgi:FixJ family two-component response regulator